MKIYKTHFWYTKSQRKWVLFLVLIIVILQGVYFFSDFSSKEITILEDSEMVSFEKTMDSLRLVKLNEKKFKLYPFNPNYITDYKGYMLGMSVDEIDRLHQFRDQNKFINSVMEFKRVTKVNDTLLKKIAPYFKFPDWVVEKQKNTPVKTLLLNQEFKGAVKKKKSTHNINLATAEDFATIKGIGEALSKRIINYRNKLQGFSYSYQLDEVWNLNSELIEQVLGEFQIIEKPSIQKVNINTANFKEVLKTPYVDYDLCKKIFDYRDEVAELQNISELKKIAGFPVEKYDRIVLYLKAE